MTGNLHAFMRKQAEAADEAVTDGIREITENLKQELRGQIVAAGLGRRLSQSWRSQIFPKGRKSIQAAGWVWSKAPVIVSAFDRGVVIKSNKGFFLAIPTSAAPKLGVGGKRIAPATFPESSLGKLRFVYRRGAPSLLVVDNLRARTGKRGGFARASESARRTGRGLATVVMFILVPQVSLKKRLDVQGATKRWESRLPETILKQWPNVESQEEALPET